MLRVFSNSSLRPLPLLSAAVLAVFLACYVKTSSQPDEIRHTTKLDNEDQIALLQTRATAHPRRKQAPEDDVKAYNNAQEAANQAQKRAEKAVEEAVKATKTADADAKALGLDVARHSDLEVVRFDSGATPDREIPKRWGKGTLGRLLVPGCGRCKDHPNIIQLVGRTPSKLMDTLTNIDTFISIAASLCARIEVRPPCEMLQADRQPQAAPALPSQLQTVPGELSYGRLLSLYRNVSWNHFINATFPDGTSCFASPEEVDEKDCFSKKNFNPHDQKKHSHSNHDSLNQKDGHNHKDGHSQKDQSGQESTAQSDASDQTTTPLPSTTQKLPWPWNILSDGDITDKNMTDWFWETVLGKISNSSEKAEKKVAAQEKKCITYVEIPTKKELFTSQFKMASMVQKMGKVFRWKVDYDWKSIPTRENTRDESHEDTVGVFHDHSRICDDHKIQPSLGISQGAKKFREEMGLRISEYTVLHIERGTGQARSVCDTSVDNVVSYVNCTLGEEKGRNETIVFFTDEQDGMYLTELQGKLSSQLHIQAYHGDAIMAGLFGKERGGHPFIQEVSIVIAMQSRYDLLMDHTHCNSCDIARRTPYCHPCQAKDKCTTTCSFMEYVAQNQYQKLAVNADAGQEDDHAVALCPPRYFEGKSIQMD